MDLRAFFRRLREKERDRLVREGLNEHLTDSQDVFLTPGLDRTIREQAERLDNADEHETHVD